MARALKPLEVGQVQHKKLNQPVKVFYDREAKLFHGTLTEGKPITAETQLECERKIRDEIEESVNLDWTQIIIVERLEPFHSGNFEPFVGFKMRRHEVAKLKDGPDPRQKEQWIERDFRDPEEEPNWLAKDWQAKGWDTKRFYYPRESDAKTTVLPYTKDMWLGLQALQDRIVRAGEQLTELLKSPDLPKMLERVRATAPALLPAAEEYIGDVKTGDSWRGTGTVTAPALTEAPQEEVKDAVRDEGHR